MCLVARRNGPGPHHDRRMVERGFARCLWAVRGEFLQPMHAAVSYAVRVFLYMALAQARVVKHAEYDEALRRAAGLGNRKRAKLLQRFASRYNSILVGPESLPSTAAAGGTGRGVAAH